MNQINAVTLGKLIAAHREGDEQKFKTYVDFIAKAYEEQGNDRAANIIRSNYTGDYGEQGKVVLDETTISHLEKQPQTFKKLLFAKEYFKNVYALLNDTDKMFADIVISDCPGCTKLLKSLQNFAEEQSKNV